MQRLQREKNFTSHLETAILIILIIDNAGKMWFGEKTAETECVQHPQETAYNGAVKMRGICI
ncbi:hypothetical protein A6770_03675 [Nostoc minutum NIES-26]|uniref:Uncharacterized protein n=1 Tax=Nostoc minutum NIES-26 TaxID=1844469 RepID=A0A367QKN4_9NOSO|nr:hypothetical protein A6770_03675 [Nostoc minutum NIES-26]